MSSQIVCKKHEKFSLSYLVAVAASIMLASCSTTTSNVETKEDKLAAAGFVQRPANTPQRRVMLKRLPPNKFLERTRGNTVNYVYADPVNCNCLYVGTQKAYDTYRQTQLQEKIANRQLLAAQTYADADWDWNRWGPYFRNFDGPFGPGYGW
ncbi:hypothetical protein QA644_24655 (plasmid) [Rhizobium sp. CC1099]|uniref:hypothetical protein n=1 Tax=Rhizobium sp. CC1099 TaxID=3039160 RepID=UPI0024B236AA|nr:hypothetical protein [Rhizobium sp. CC1099]WFU91362.1 hypothetical protein QA644_24655 [Rhizobium sp. CC1099]